MKVGFRRAAISLVSVAAISFCGVALAQDSVGVTKDTIKIGMFAPMTGSAALFGKAAFGVEAVFRDVNDHGGIHGRKIEVIREDTGCDPARGIAAFKKLLSQEKVFAMDAGLCSNVMMALKPEIQKSGIPFMGLGAASPTIATPLVANLFQPVATTEAVSKTMIDFAMSKPGTSKIAFVSHSDDWGKSNLDPAIRHLKDKYHLQPELNLTMDRGATDATPQILKIRAAHPDFVVLMLYPTELAIFMRDAHKYGLNIPTLAPQSISLEDTKDRAGMDAVQNLFVFYPYAHTTDSPEMQKWAHMINKYFPSERVESFSFLGMSGALALVDALKAAGPDLTRQGVVANLDKIKAFDPGIASAPMTFTTQDHAGVKTGAMITYVNNQPKIIKSWAER